MFLFQCTQSKVWIDHSNMLNILDNLSQALLHPQDLSVSDSRKQGKIWCGI